MVRRVRENLLSSPILDIVGGYLHFAVSRGSLEMADCAGYVRGKAENPFTSCTVGANPRPDGGAHQRGNTVNSSHIVNIAGCRFPAVTHSATPPR